MTNHVQAPKSSTHASAIDGQPAIQNIYSSMTVCVFRPHMSELTTCQCAIKWYQLRWYLRSKMASSITLKTGCSLFRVGPDIINTTFMGRGNVCIWTDDRLDLDRKENATALKYILFRAVTIPTTRTSMSVLLYYTVPNVENLYTIPHFYFTHSIESNTYIMWQKYTHICTL